MDLTDIWLSPKILGTRIRCPIVSVEVSIKSGNYLLNSVGRNRSDGPVYFERKAIRGIRNGPIRNSHLEAHTL